MTNYWESDLPHRPDLFLRDETSGVSKRVGPRRKGGDGTHVDLSIVVEVKKRFGWLWTHAMQCRKRLQELGWGTWLTVTLQILSACNREARKIGPGFGLAGAIAVVSCAPVIGKKDLLAFLQVGQTTRQDVYLHLGDPSNEYEGGRIVTFRIGEDEGGLYPMVRTPSWRYDRYSLVLAFDETGVLRKYSLVQVRSP